MSKMYEYDDNYTVGEGTVPIKIVKGAYKGTIFSYGEVSFSEVKESVKCHFEYNLIEKPDGLIEDKIFVNQLGDILVDILSEEIEEVGEDFLRQGMTLNNEDS